MFNWIKRLFTRKKKQVVVTGTPHIRVQRVPSLRERYVGKQHVTYPPLTHSHVLADEDERRCRQDDSGSGFVTGLVLGSLLSSGSDSAPSYDPSPSFDSGFSGGASGGGGADSSWDSAPSCDTSSFDSGSSSFDSGSSCSDFSGGGSSDFGS